jgi:carboxyl-terminal processing protease
MIAGAAGVERVGRNDEWIHFIADRAAAARRRWPPRGARSVLCASPPHHVELAQPHDGSLFTVAHHPFIAEVDLRRMLRRNLAVLLLVPGVAGGWAVRSLLPDDGPKLFSQVLQIVNSQGIGGLSQDAVYERAARGLVDRLDDRYADLYSPEELATFSREQLRAAYGGLGMQIEDQQGVITVTRVFPNTPAERGGVRAGDRVTAVNGASTRGLKIEEVSGRLIGEAGTTVQATFSRAGVSEPITGTFKRAVVHVPAVPYAVVLEGGVGYIPLQSFNETSSNDVRNAVRTLRSKGATSLVLDVRGNGGGSLEEALMISNLFLPSGEELARVEYRERKADVYTARNTTVTTDLPMVVLTDGYSASASEIVAGALQDHDRALVLGTSSYGKGLVQQIYPLDGGWALKLTTGKWFTPSGRSIQLDRAEDGTPLLADTATRPQFRSDAGRIVYGGGGITPDLIVQLDTMDAAEREFSRVVGAKGPQVYVSVYDQALAVKDRAVPDFTVTSEWRDELFDRLRKAEVPVTREQYEAARPLIDRMLEQRVASLAFGDSAAFRRMAPRDAHVRTAVELLQQGLTQMDLFAIVDRRNAAVKSD